MATITQTTLLDLVQAVNRFASSEAELVTTVASLVNSGQVRLCGNFAGATIDLAVTPALSAKVSPRCPMTSSRRSSNIAVQ